MKIVLLTLLTLAPSLLAADGESPRSTFPDDFTPQACAPANSCESFSESELRSAAFRFLGFDMEPRWLAAHYADMQQALAPVCRKQATCIATPGNGPMFCNDIVAPMMRNVCVTKFPKDKQPHDFEQCQWFTETFALGVDQHSRRIAAEAQKCAGAPTAHAKPPIVWMSPSPIPADYKGPVGFYALDPDTHVPVPALVTFEGQKHYSPANPTGETATFYPFKLPFKYIEVPNANGHRDLVPPMVTVAAPYYPPVQFRLEAIQPKLVVEMTPPPAKLKRGVTVTVHVTEAESGKPAELRVYVGDVVAGDTTQPMTISWPKGKKRPEIWARSLFNRYSDVVIAPAEK